jgi:hypothetical protein
MEHIPLAVLDMGRIRRGSVSAARLYLLCGVLLGGMVALWLQALPDGGYQCQHPV